ncbi:MAG: type II toxin-antitoxin system RelB/DinJ family antitoxin [Clostridiales bacterium]|nr:type II toxin-antitoxin system RelB/DinJ family antitoxin [Clostridiales bacterium]
MEMTNLNVRVNKEVKAAAEQIFETLGLNMTTAINMFLRQTVLHQGLPFNVTLHIPNEVTAAAIEEGRALAKDPNAKGYHSAEELIAALLD